MIPRFLTTEDASDCMGVPGKCRGYLRGVFLEVGKHGAVEISLVSLARYVMFIKRHAVDENHAKERFEYTVSQLDSSVEWAKKNPKNLSSLTSESLEIIAYGCVTSLDSPEIEKALAIGAQAHTAMFAIIPSSESTPITVPLGDGESVTYISGADSSTVHIGRWLTGFYMNVLTDDAYGMDLLCGATPDALRASPTKSPEYDYLYMEALQLFRAGRQETGPKIIEALKATNPANARVFDSDWSLYLVAHELEVLMYVATQDKGEFGPALAKAVEFHKKYWNKTKRRREDYGGYVSIPLTALAKLGRERGLPFDVESPYLAMHLVEG